MPDFSGRFTGRAEAYSRYRPGYPRRILGALTSEIGFNRAKIVADIGSGTGRLTELFLQNGNVVYAVEPNSDMRALAEERLGRRFPRSFISVSGRAERTTLPPSSVDLIVAGQALHWFDIGAARREFSRILRPGGSLCVVYNDRKSGKGIMNAYGRIARSFHRRMPAGVSEINRAALRRYFSSYMTLSFPNSQRLDCEGLLGRLLSASYAPAPDDVKGRERLGRSVRRIFLRYSRNGRVTLRYTTRVYLGSVGRGA